jgi:hypothetical protein
VSCAGCGGCRKSDAEREEAERRAAEERLKKEKEKPKPPFEMPRVAVRPSESKGLGTSNIYYKPGHWTSLLLADVKANDADFSGELETVALDRNSEPVALMTTPFQLADYRPVVLAKGQPKSLEAFVWIPPVRETKLLGLTLTAGRSGSHAHAASLPVIRMPSCQYYFVVLCESVARYGYLDFLPSIKPGIGPDRLEPGADPPHYRVIRLTKSRRVDLPSHALYWTAIAYLLWDDVSPDALDPSQQQALLDWLHWGGQLILSGPDTLDLLPSSFLGPYLPATPEGTRQLATADLAELDRWRQPSMRELRAVKPWAGVRLKKCPGGEFLPDTGDLLAERAVGRGRIVVSAFRLNNSDLVNWPGWDNLFNACLLRRPARRFVTRADSAMHVEWQAAGSKQGAPGSDAQQTTKLRYFVRDAGVTFAEYAPDLVVHRENPASGDPFAALPGEIVLESDRPPGPGLAAWNDFSPVAKAARRALADASGITVPERSFIVWVVVVYLLVLVPLNWSIFQVLRRVEWAWAAAPLIALCCAALVVHLAQLNIGFARSQNEIAVVELHGSYPRAHVTRYTALYTSLATSYQLDFVDPGAQVLPLPTKDPGAFRMLAGQSYQRLVCRRGEGTSLSGFAVSSNDTKLLHSEHLLDVGGSLALVDSPDGRRQLVNSTQLSLHGVGLVRRTPAGSLEEAWLGNVLPGATVPAEFALEAQSESGAKLWRRERDLSVRTAAGAPGGEVNLRGLMEIAQNTADLRPAQTRLIAWLDDELPGESVAPAAPQKRCAALVVAELDSGRAPPPRPDVNARPWNNQGNDSEPDEF